VEHGRPIQKSQPQVFVEETFLSDSASTRCGAVTRYEFRSCFGIEMSDLRNLVTWISQLKEGMNYPTRF